MDIISLTQAIAALLTPLLPILIKMGEKSAEEIGKKAGESAWNFAKKIWLRLTPKIDANASAKEAISDLVKNPKDNDYFVAFKVQIRKILESDPSLAQELYSQINNINNAARDININIGNIHVNGNLSGSNVASGNGNVFQNGTNNYNYTVNAEKVDKIVFGKENRTAEIREVTLSFLQPDGSFPKRSWVEKVNAIESMLGKNLQTVNEKWTPSGIDMSILRGFLIKEINQWTLQGWEVLEMNFDNLFITEHGSSETMSSILGDIFLVPTGFGRNHWRIYSGARFHVRRLLD